MIDPSGDDDDGSGDNKDKKDEDDSDQDCAIAPPKDGVIPPKYDDKLSDQEKESFRSIKPIDNMLVDRHKEG
jgi:hypothetical protein